MVSLLYAKDMLCSYVEIIQFLIYLFKINMKARLMLVRQNQKLSGIMLLRE